MRLYIRLKDRVVLWLLVEIEDGNSSGSSNSIDFYLVKKDLKSTFYNILNKNKDALN